MADDKLDSVQRLSRVGRKAGGQNRVSQTVKEAFMSAFEMLGGAEGLARWAREPRTLRIGKQIIKSYPNLETFYVLAAKLIPSESKTSVSGHVGHYVAKEIAVEQRDKLPGPRAHAAMQHDIIEGEIVPESGRPDNGTDALGLDLP